MNQGLPFWGAAQRWAAFLACKPRPSSFTLGQWRIGMTLRASALSTHNPLDHHGCDAREHGLGHRG